MGESKDTSTEDKGAADSTRRRFEGKSPDAIRAIYESYRKSDPHRGKRNAILKAYYRHPSKSKNKGKCLLEDPNNTNYGMLTAEVDKRKTRYLDMLHSRERAFEIKIDSDLSEIPNARATEWGKQITLAFNKFFIKKWSGFGYNFEVNSLDMCLYGKAIEYFPDPQCAFSTHLPVDHCIPNSEASHLPEEWDSCFILKEITLSALWGYVENLKWNKEVAVGMVKSALGDSYNSQSEEAMTRAIEDGTCFSDMETKTVWVTYFLYREYKGLKKVSLKVLPFTATGSKDGFLKERNDYVDCFCDVISLFIDDAGHGKFYKTPSYAEQLYPAHLNFDRKMNKAADAVEINSLLMFKGGSSSVSKGITKHVIGDRLYFPDGSEPIQHRISLPVGESAEFARAIWTSTTSQYGGYEVGGTNRAGGKTPKSATQSANDANVSASLQSAYIRRFNAQLTKWGQTLFKRFINLTEGDEGYHMLRKFRKYLELKGVDIKILDDEDNYSVESKVLVGAGDDLKKFQVSVEVLNVLSRAPKTKGERRAQRDALIALVGPDDADEYLISEQEMGAPDYEDWIIGQENESMRSQGSTIESFPVIEENIHARHLFGKEIEGAAIGHLADADNSLSMAVKMLQYQPAPDEIAMFLDKISTVITEVDLKLKHSSMHVQQMQQDKGNEELMKRAIQHIALLEKALQAVAGNLQQMQQARAQMLAQQQENQQQQGAGLTPEAQQRLMAQKAMDDLKLGHQVQMMELKKEDFRMKMEQDQREHVQEMHQKADESVAKSIGSAKG